MYAVFRSGGKQYRATEGETLRLEKIDADEGASLTFDEVLLVGEGNDVRVGNPLVAGGAVSATVVRQGKSRKVPVVKFRRRQNYLRQGSHRQFYTEVKITDISAGGNAGSGDDATKKKTAASKSADAGAGTKKKTAKKKPAAKTDT